MKARDLLSLLQGRLDPDDDVKCIEETRAAITVNIRSHAGGCTTVGRVHIIPKPEPPEDVIAENRAFESQAW